MDPEIIKEKAGIRYGILIPVIILLTLILYYSVMLMISPLKKVADLRHKINITQTDSKEIDERILIDSLYLKLLREKAFIQSKVTMAATDSNYLIINLKDSLANIEISGIVVHSAGISRIETSKILQNEDETIIQTLLSAPLRISVEYATIQKEPVMIKIAPKDTSEYKPDIMPDTSLVEPVNFIMEMSNGIKIYVYQEEHEKFSDRVSRWKFDLNDRLRYAWASMKSIILFKIPEYQPFIKLELPGYDAKIIYRAIPKNGQTSISL